MTLNFYLRFKTHFGQTIFISGNSDALGNNDILNAIPLEYLNDQFCHCQVEIPVTDIDPCNIEYRYILKDLAANEIVEGRDDKSIDFSGSHITEITLIDTWNHAGTIENAFYTKPFKDVLLKVEKNSKNKNADIASTHEFKVKYPLLKDNEVLCITGSGKALGNWDIANPLFLSKHGNWWRIKINLLN